MNDSVEYMVFAIIIGVHLLPLIILCWPRLNSFVTTVGIIVNIVAWYIVDTSVAIAYPLLSAVAGLFLLTTLYICGQMKLYDCSPIGHLINVFRGKFFAWHTY